MPAAQARWAAGTPDSGGRGGQYGAHSEGGDLHGGGGDLRGGGAGASDIGDTRSALAGRRSGSTGRGRGGALSSGAEYSDGVTRRQACPRRTWRRRLRQHWRRWPRR
eukprot:TRINITY_DN3034_c0_g3_i1.p1 TRINITY_DN3034_c0_g3~~TRINITY_DN3034_c0_g3_i1.p1  ORF type:complete len:107 (-),score=22.51 TRINITY_DN3034_c0_g3_i1:519-839(-)